MWWPGSSAGLDTTAPLVGAWLWSKADMGQGSQHTIMYALVHSRTAWNHQLYHIYIILLQPIVTRLFFKTQDYYQTPSEINLTIDKPAISLNISQCQYWRTLHLGTSGQWPEHLKNTMMLSWRKRVKIFNKNKMLRINQVEHFHSVVCGEGDDQSHAATAYSHRYNTHSPSSFSPSIADE